MMKVLPTKIVVIDRTGVRRPQKDEYRRFQISFFVWALVIQLLVGWAIYAWCAKEGWMR